MLVDIESNELLSNLKDYGAGAEEASAILEWLENVEGGLADNEHLYILGWKDLVSYTYLYDSEEEYKEDTGYDDKYEDPEYLYTTKEGKVLVSTLPASLYMKLSSYQWRGGYFEGFCKE